MNEIVNKFLLAGDEFRKKKKEKKEFRNLKK